ncbi:MAG: lipopolysaccharide heptosyltransferase II [Vicinamibacterales bacterium]
MPEAPGRIVVAAPNWLGDAVMGLPAVRAVRAFAPDAHLAVAARPGVAALYAMVPEVDGVVPLAPRAPITRPAVWRADAARLAAERFDLAILLPNSFLSAWTAARAGIPERWGYAAQGRARLLTRRVRRPRGLPHQADYYLTLTAALDLPEVARVAPVAVPAAARAAAAALLGGGGPHVVMAPGAAYGRAKQWPPERFAELAALLWRRGGLATVIVGAGADHAASRELQDALGAVDGGRAAQAAMIDLVGRTDLATLAAVLERARAVVANDSGAMHLAGAVGAPVVAVFGATNEHHTAPLPAALDGPAAAIATHDVWCRPCMLRECPLGHQCMRGVSAAAVAALI